MRTFHTGGIASAEDIAQGLSLIHILLTAAETATPWYGQLMATPQTIAWCVQLNYWLQKYRVEMCIRDSR